MTADPGNDQPVLIARRVRLRPYRPDDAERLSLLAGREEIAQTTISIPHPYSPLQAREWIAGHAGEWRKRRAARFAVELSSTSELIGGAELREIEPEHAQAELSFWVGTEWWGHGYATEAAEALLDYGFLHLGLNRIYAYHMTRNPASGKVLRKLGMRQEALMRERVRKWGAFEDGILYASLSKDQRDRVRDDRVPVVIVEPGTLRSLW